MLVMRRQFLEDDIEIHVLESPICLGVFFNTHLVLVDFLVYLCVSLCPLTLTFSLLPVEALTF